MKELPAIVIDASKCTARLACVRVCPTEAIRVRKGKLTVKPELCIDCGDCIVACPEGAIQPRTDPFNSIEAYKFKIAIVSPSLFGQFPSTISPVDIVEGLLAIGFDAVYDLSIESELFNKAIQDYLAEYDGPRPVISSMCPVVVRLIQVSYPDMVDQVIPLQPPREIAGREAKKYFSMKLKIPESDIGAIYVSPCPAKMASIKQPAEGARSHLDMAIGISDIYNPLLHAIMKFKKPKGPDQSSLPDNALKSRLVLSLAMTGGQSKALQQEHSISVAQLPNIIHVIEDIEKGKIRNVDFLECRACTGGCVGGPLTVDNRFVARSKLQDIIDRIGRERGSVEDEIESRYVKGDYFLVQPLKPRPVSAGSGTIFEQIERVKVREEIIKMLPGIDCSLCGAPTCAAFANDIANGEAESADCVLLSPERIKKLRRLYKIETPENHM